jgi:hypothetical protein
MSTPIKLRSSCDSCAIAKVRCDKQQPICERCQKSRFTCSYGLSRRHGKQSWLKRLAEQRVHQARVTPVMSTVSNGPAIAVDLMPGAKDPNHGPPTLTLSTNFDRQPCPSINEEQVCRMNTEQSVVPYFDALNDAPVDSLSHLTSVDAGLEFAGDIRPPERFDTDEGVNLDVPGATNGAPFFQEQDSMGDSTRATIFRTSIHDCEAKAMAALYSLHYCTVLRTDIPTESSRKLGTITSHMIPLDKILFCNRKAIRTLQALLDCPCAYQPHLALLYATIISKVMYWYRLAFASQDPSRSSSNLDDLQDSNGTFVETSLTSTDSSLHCGPTSRAVKSAAVQIGGFELEGPEQRQLTRSILAMEVRNLKAVVARMKTFGDGSTNTVEDGDKRLGSHWYATTGPRLMAEIDEILRIETRS